MAQKKPGKPAKSSGKKKAADRKEAAGKKAAYVRARVAGQLPTQALAEAGYRPKNRRNARSMARRLEIHLRDQGALDAALVATGVSHELIAQAVYDNLVDPEEPDRRMQAARVLGKWLGFERQRVEIAGPFDAYGYEDRKALRERLRSELERRRTGPGPAGPGGGG